MKSLRLLPFGVIALAVLMVAATACGNPSNQPVAPTLTPVVTPVIIPPVITGRHVLVVGDGPFFAGSIASLLKVYPNVVVGRVEDVLQHFDPRPGFLGLPESYIKELEAAPPGKGGPIPSDMLARPPGSGSSIYAVRVLANVVGDGPRANGMFALVQPGGVFENVAYENSGDPAVLPGLTYLFFLKSFQNSSYHLPIGYEDLPQDYQRLNVSSAEARLLVVDGRLEAPSLAWAEECPDCVGTTLIGLTLSEGITLILGANGSPEASTRNGAPSSLRAWNTR